MSHAEEKKWLKRAAAGDADAFEKLVVHYQTPIYNLCLRLTGNAQDAADMTQESFLKAWRSLESFHGDAAFSTWLYRLASNCCMDLLRSRKRKAALSLRLTQEDGEELTVDVPDSAPSPEEALLQKETHELLWEAMSALEPQQRQILTLRVINGLSYDEIAQVLSLKTGTVKSRIARARMDLKKKIEKIGNKTDSPASKNRKGGRENAM